MTGEELISVVKVRDRIYDTLKATYQDEELCSYINEGIILAWKFLSNEGYYEVIGDHTFTASPETLPADFGKFICAYPIVLKDSGSATIYGSLPQETRYIKKQKLLTSLDDDMPFTNDAINHAIGQIVIMLALNRNEYAVDFESNVVNQLMQSIT